MTIDTNELRRLAQAATPGPWWFNRDGLNHGFARGVVEINANDWHALAGAWAVNGAKHSDEGVANAEFIAAANPAAVSELLDRLEAAEKERDAAELMSLALRAKIAEMEKQEPAGTLHDDGCFVWRETAPHQSNYAGWKMALYALPGAQTQGEEE